MVKGNKKVNIGQVFGEKSCLHMIIWDRFCDKTHTSGLRLVRMLIDNFDLVMPMLRPLGRKSNGYIVGMKNDFQEPVPNSISVDIPSAPILPENYSGHCELWVQIADSINDSVLEFLKSYIDEQNGNFAIFLNHNTPDWAPFGRSYAKTRYEFGTRTDYEIKYDISEKQLPGFLKLIWYLSSVIIADWFSTQGQNISWIDPFVQKDVLYDLMGKIFTDINPGEYGISSSFDSIDPSEFGIAHMAAFAINAITKVYSVYQIEQYFRNSNITRPYYYSHRDEYLKQFLF